MPPQESRLASVRVGQSPGGWGSTMMFALFGPLRWKLEQDIQPPASCVPKDTLSHQISHVTC